MDWGLIAYVGSMVNINWASIMNFGCWLIVYHYLYIQSLLVSLFGTWFEISRQKTRIYWLFSSCSISFYNKIYVNAMVRLMNSIATRWYQYRIYQWTSRLYRPTSLLALWLTRTCYIYREVHEEVSEARQKASTVRSRRQEQDAARREKLRQAYLKKRLENTAKALGFAVLWHFGTRQRP